MKKQLSILILAASVARAGDARATPPERTTATETATETTPSAAADGRGQRSTLGFEADVLPYVLRGAHGDAWVGFRGWRVRAIAVTTVAPSFFTQDGFANARTTMFEIEVDRFFGSHADEFRGPWVAAGGGISLLRVETSDRAAHASTTVPEVSAGVGWAFARPLHFYVNPWIGAGYQFAPSAINVAAQTWNPPRFGPALGIKLGWDVAL